MIFQNDPVRGLAKRVLTNGQVVVGEGPTDQETPTDFREIVSVFAKRDRAGNRISGSPPGHPLPA